MTERRLLFGSVAEQYDRYRPGYPTELVDYVLSYLGSRAATAKVVDVGAGTGQATRLFAPRVSHVTSIEPDDGMAAAAIANVDAPANVTYLQGDFEQSGLPDGSFDLLISGTAWHWVSPQVRYQLAAAVLAPGGVLAVFWNGPDWTRSALRAELEAAYERSAVNLAEHRYGVMHPGGQNPLQMDFGESWDQQIGVEPLLSDGDVQIFPWTQSYTADEYVSLIATHSDHIMLSGPEQERLYAEVTGVIERNGGSFEMPYRSLLCLARRS